MWGNPTEFQQKQMNLFQINNRTKVKGKKEITQVTQYFDYKHSVYRQNVLQTNQKHNLVGSFSSGMYVATAKLLLYLVRLGKW